MCTRHLQRAPLGTGPSCGMWTVPCKWASRLVFSPALENHSGQHHLKQGALAGGGLQRCDQWRQLLGQADRQ